MQISIDDFFNLNYYQPTNYLKFLNKSFILTKEYLGLLGIFVFLFPFIILFYLPFLLFIFSIQYLYLKVRLKKIAKIIEDLSIEKKFKIYLKLEELIKNNKKNNTKYPVNNFVVRLIVKRIEYSNKLYENIAAKLESQLFYKMPEVSEEELKIMQKSYSNINFEETKEEQEFWLQHDLELLPR